LVYGKVDLALTASKQLNTLQNINIKQGHSDCDRKPPYSHVQTPPKCENCPKRETPNISLF
jgi:hypothetical protein